MKISTILDQIDLGSMALPEFQRGYVWNRTQVRDLMNSLYRGYPVGSLLVWVTKTATTEVRGEGHLQPGSVELILDGQQRISSVYGIVRGTPPPFFEGNFQAFTGVYFHLQDETFEFYGPLKMKDNPFWVDVTAVMKNGLGAYVGRMYNDPELQPHADLFTGRLTTLHGIQAIDLHIEKVTGSDKTVDIVVDIFNRVNSGGTKLSKGDLALARICAEWPDARQAIRGRLRKWGDAGFHFTADWFLRNVNTVCTGEALFSALKDIDAATFQKGLQSAEHGIEYLLDVIAGRLGLDHDRVLGGRYAFPIMTRYLTQRGGRFAGAVERDRMLYWYVHSFLWGRFAGATESTLNRDLGVMESQPAQPLDALIDELGLWRGNLQIRPEDFAGWSVGARFYPMLYMLTRVGEAQDWGSGIPLKAHMLGKLSRLEVHHIFPRALLYRHNYTKSQVNALANFCFQTQGTNLNIRDKPPEAYFEEIESAFPGALASQWIPMDRELWRVERYPDFLQARQELLARAANEFLDGLLAGTVPDEEPVPITFHVREPVVLGGIDGGEEETLLLECNVWVLDQELPEGELLYEATNPDTGELLVVIDLAWPDGLQAGFSQPVALLIDEEPETQRLVNGLGYRFFTEVSDFKRYVESEILALEPVSV